MPGILRTTQICTSCGKEYRMDKMYFHRSRSPLYRANENFITVCKSCMAELYEKMFIELGGSKELTLKKIAIIFDLPYSRDIMAKTNDRKAKHIQQHITDCYFYVISKLPYVHQTFSAYKDQMNYVIGENNPIVDAKLDIPRKKLASVWGSGFTEEEYEYLQNRYDEWNCKVNIDSMSRESLVRDLCMIKLQQQKALSNEDVDVYNRLQKTYQETLSTAHLKPIQEEVEQKSFEKPLGVMIEMFENEDPIPEPLPEWRDVDGIVKLFNVYFLGHLCKMLNIENRYSGMYEEEMQKYRAESEDLYDASDEDIFEHLVETGFPSIKPKTEHKEEKSETQNRVPNQDPNEVPNEFQNEVRNEVRNEVQNQVQNNKDNDENELRKPSEISIKPESLKAFQDIVNEIDKGGDYVPKEVEKEKTNSKYKLRTRIKENDMLDIDDLYSE